MEPGLGVRSHRVSPCSLLTTDLTLGESFSPAYLQSRNGSPWLRWRNARRADRTPATQDCLLATAAAPCADYADGRQGMRGRNSLCSACLAGAPSLHSVNEWTERLLVKSSLARSAFSLSWGPPSFVWIWEDGLGNWSVWNHACLFVLGAAPRR